MAEFQLPRLAVLREQQGSLAQFKDIVSGNEGYIKRYEVQRTLDGHSGEHCLALNAAFSVTRPWSLPSIHRRCRRRRRNFRPQAASTPSASLQMALCSPAAATTS